MKVRTMNALSIKTAVRQAGMTLIELSVVLLILIALASLMIPYVGGFLEKAATSTGAASTAEVYNSLALYQTQFGAYPDNLDLLADAAGNIDATLDDFTQTPNVAKTGGTIKTPSDNLMNWGPVQAAAGAAAGAAPVAADTVANIIASLQAPGSAIKKVVRSPHTTVTYNADGAATINNIVTNITFDPAFSNGANFALAAGAGVPQVAGFVTTQDGMFAHICSNAAPYNAPNVCPGSPNTANYGGTIGNMLGYKIPAGHAIIVLGIGSLNSAIGKTMAQAPVVFAATPTAQPHLVYSRYLAAFDVDASHLKYDDNLKAAKLVGIVFGPSSMMFEGTGSSISNFYNGLKEQNMN
jgi:type II secretory pathway pseudopilin PulG